MVHLLTAEFSRSLSKSPATRTQTGIPFKKKKEVADLGSINSPNDAGK